MSAMLSINYIEFSCRRIPEIKAFYHAAFGWTFTDYGPDYVAFNDGKLDGGFSHNEQHAPGGSPLVILYTTALEEAREKVKTSGGTITEDIFAFPGGRRFHFADPDGNVLAVWSDKE
ncbi:VOC family protein [Taibaiella koreensis]|uniref:VOC family protein n=1 Tax=Taibaiella koreensis TaxID=1268548 RepID=UPI000E59F687|nr:VOC family protein [Taibaiella koreensis]